MMTVLGAVLGCVGTLSIAWGVHMRRQLRRQRQVKAREAARHESQREAHYMRNFWSYDGSEQEEFDE